LKIKGVAVMKIAGFTLCVVGLCSTVLMLAGCTERGSQLADTPVQNGASPSSVREPLGLPQVAALGTSGASRKEANLGPSWMAPEAKNEDLLYISNVYTVTVYSYPKGKHVGTLKGFYRPIGECSDKAGDVFIANGDTIVEYRHGGKKPIQTLTFPGYAAQLCSTDPTTGNLAVTWDKGFSQGYVAVYQDAKGTAALYSNGNMLFSFCGYDNMGNLYVDGQYGEKQSDFAFAELPKGSGTLKSITLNQSIEFAGPVQWDGRYVAVGDNEAERIYQFTISGSSGTLEGTMSLGDAQSIEQWWIDGKRVVGSDDIPSTVWYWSYPAGGSATKSITKDVFHPFGATLSKAKK
jgi:hypothetical protein